MANNILTAKVAIVRFGSIEIEGLLIEDGRYAVAQQQAAKLFQIIPTSAPKWLKSILGKDASLFLVKTNREQIYGVRSRSSEKALSLKDFETLIVELSFEGDKTAQLMSRALIGLSLAQVFSDSFGVVFEKAERQSYLASRISQIPDKTRPQHFSPDWQKEASRVTGYHWQGMPMANFIRRSVYGPLGVGVTERLNVVNPYVAGTSHRENLHYQHFDAEVDERVLKAHISEVLTLLKMSATQIEFWRLMQNRFGVAIQLQLELG
jgi:hypothetical protein